MDETKIKPQETSDVVKPLQTYERDIADAIRNDQASVVKVAVAEEVKKEVEHKTAEVASTYKKNTLLTTLSVILVILAVGALGTLYYLQKNKPKIVKTTTEQTAIAVDQTREIDITNKSSQEIRTVLFNEKTKEGGRAGTITYLKLTEKSTEANAASKNITSEKILNKIGEDAPSPLIRAFDEIFMYGFHNSSGTEPFMIIGVGSFDNAFDGMLSWEKNMWANLGVFMKRGDASTISEPRRAFEDMVIKNRDTRVLKNTSGEIILLYSFLNEKTLLVTTNESTFKEVLNRFLASKLVR